jgi:hypothetical protein
MLVAPDRELTQDTELQCMGGFVLAEYYGLVRATADVDVLESAGTDKATIALLAGRGSPLHKRHRVYIDIVTVGDLPDDYDLTNLDLALAAPRQFHVTRKHTTFVVSRARPFATSVG